MISIQTHKGFDKQFKKLTAKQQIKFEERTFLFKKDQFHPLLKNHSLTGKFKGLKSFNVTADIRVIFEEIDESTVVFHFVGTHSELYS